MAKKAVNFGGYATPEARARVARRTLSVENLVATMRALGMTDEEIRAALLEMRQERQPK